MTYLSMSAPWFGPCQHAWVDLLLRHLGPSLAHPWRWNERSPGNAQRVAERPERPRPGRCRCLGSGQQPTGAGGGASDPQDAQSTSGASSRSRLMLKAASPTSGWSTIGSVSRRKSARRSRPRRSKPQSRYRPHLAMTHVSVAPRTAERCGRCQCVNSRAASGSGVVAPFWTLMSQGFPDSGSAVISTAVTE